jgi:hypothetical protein
MPTLSRCTEQEREQAEQRTHQQHATVAILYVGP